MTGNSEQTSFNYLRYASYSEAVNQDNYSSGEYLYPVDDLPLKPMTENDNTRPGVFQRLDFTADYISSGGGAQSLAMSKISLQAVFGFPCPSKESPLLITPYFESTFLSDTPADAALSSTLYRTGVNIAWVAQLTDRWGIYAYISPAISSDFRASDSAFRLPSGVVGTYKWNDKWTVTLGAAYTSYSSWPVSPICGLTWTPCSDWRFEFLIPRPRICHKMNSPWSQNRYWVYIGGEYGAGTWAVKDEFNNDDLLSYRDLRACLGIEKDNRTIGKLDFNAEIGVSFWRKLYYDNSPVEYCPNPGLFARFKILY